MCSLRFSPLPTPREKAAGQERRRGGGRLGDDRGVDAGRRAGDPREKPQSLGGLGERAEHSPDERTLPLLVDPGVKVVGDAGKREADLLGPNSVLYESLWTVLLTGERVADLRHAIGLPGVRTPNLSQVFTS